MIFAALIGLGALSWGGFSLWRHNRLDTTGPVYTIDDLPLDQRVRGLRRMILIVLATFARLTAFMGYQLAQMEFGWAERVTVWGPVALLYRLFGFWPAVLFVPGLGLLAIMGLVRKLRTIREANPSVIASSTPPPRRRPDR